MQMDPEAEHYAEYQCQACDGWILEHERFDMIRDEKCGGTARWVPRATCAPGRRSYFIWAAYSPWKSWRAMCDAWNEAKGDPEEEQVTCNTLFGEAYEFQHLDFDHDELFRRREDYDAQRLPEQVEILTAGIDTQDDRFELEIVGWGAGEESWSVYYGTLEGDPEKQETRDRLDEYLETFVATRTDGKELAISAAFVDCGGHRTDSVYKFVRGKAPRHIYASKGSSIAGQPIFARFSPQKKERVKLGIVGTDTAKEVIYARLAKNEEGRGRCHFPLSYSLEYFRGLTAEEKVVKWSHGSPVVRFVKRKGENKARNEPLDCRVYALAALRSLPMARRRLWKKSASPPPRTLKESREEGPPPPDSPPPPVTPASRKKPPPEMPRRRHGGWSVY